MSIRWRLCAGSDQCVSSSKVERRVAHRFCLSAVTSKKVVRQPRLAIVYLPEKATWLSQHLHELVTFSNGKHDDQAQSTSQALDWLKNFMWEPAILVHYREKALEQYRNASNVDPKFGFRTCRSEGGSSPRQSGLVRSVCCLRIGIEASGKSGTGQKARRSGGSDRPEVRSSNCFGLG